MYFMQFLYKAKHFLVVLSIEGNKYTNCKKHCFKINCYKASTCTRYRV